MNQFPKSAGKGPTGIWIVRISVEIKAAMRLRRAIVASRAQIIPNFIV
jgi:hypothetical protein